MKITILSTLSLGIALTFSACDAQVNTAPPANVEKKETTIINPPAEKKTETNTTIVNPPAEKK